MTELRAAWRSLLRRPGFSLTVVAVLGVGIGSVLAMFSLLDAAILKALPYPESGQLVALSEVDRRQNILDGMLAPVRVEELRQSAKLVSPIAAHYLDTPSETSGEIPERLTVAFTTPGFFQVFRVAPALGRVFLPAEEGQTGRPAAVISYRFWQRRFQGSPAAVGQLLRFGGAGVPIVGVMPPELRYPSPDVDVWRTTQFPEPVFLDRKARFFRSVARLAPGVTIPQASSELHALQAEAARLHPTSDGGWELTLLPLKEKITGTSGRLLWPLFGAVALVLVVACANVASLLLAQGAARLSEFRVRMALGANTGSILRPLLLESLLLSALAALTGLLLGAWAVEGLRTLASRLPRIEEASVDWRVAIVAVAVALTATLLSGVAPALAILRDSRRVQGFSLRGFSPGTRPQQLLVAAQLSLAIMLLSAAGLLTRSLTALAATDPGFDPEPILTFRVSASWGETNNRSAVEARLRQTAARLQEIPGVAAAGAASNLPASGERNEARFRVAGEAQDRPFQVRIVSPGYLEAIGISPLEGGCQDTGRDGQPASAIANLSAIAPSRFSIGTEIRYAANPSIVYRADGFTSDVREESVSRPPEPTLYVCRTAYLPPDPWWVIRVKPGATVSLDAIQSAIAEVSPGRAVYEFQPLATRIRESAGELRFEGITLAVFSAVTLVLAASGLYGLLHLWVTRRTREIGIRMALGARRSSITARLLQESLAVVLAGAAFGLAGSAVVGRLLAPVLYQVDPHDPVTRGAALVVLFAVAALAAAIPAWRACSVDPLVALRDD